MSNSKVDLDDVRKVNGILDQLEKECDKACEEYKESAKQVDMIPFEEPKSEQDLTHSSDQLQANHDRLIAFHRDLVALQEKHDLKLATANIFNDQNKRIGSYGSKNRSVYIYTSQSGYELIAQSEKESQDD